MGIRGRTIKFVVRKFLTPNIPKRNKRISFVGANVSHRNIPVWGSKERFVYYNAGNGHVVVIAPPLGCGYEKNINLSLELRKKGASSISLDYNGFRKEEGSLNRFDIDSTINDYCKILQFAKERYDYISITGSCFGADIAYLSSMSSDVPLEQAVLHAPLMPWERSTLKKYIPKVWIFNHPVYKRVAKALRKTDKIALSEILNNSMSEHGFDAVLFEQKDIEKYLKRKPGRIRKEVSVALIGTEYDRFVPFEHTQELAERLKQKHDSVNYFIGQNDHHLFNNNPKYAAGIILDRFELYKQPKRKIETWKR